MVKVLMVAVTLLALLTDYAFCGKEEEYSGTEEKQYDFSRDTAFRNNISTNEANRPEKPKQRSMALKNVKNQSVSLRMLNEDDLSNETFSKESTDRDVYVRQYLHHVSHDLPRKSKKNNLLGKVIQKPTLKNPRAGLIFRDSVTGSKRAAPAAAGVVAKIAGNEKVQTAVVEKGIELAGKLVDKQLKNIDEAQTKASDFLKRKIKVDITPDKGWQTEDMFIPPGYHIGTEMEAEKSPHSPDEPPAAYTYPAGLGTVMMNGCWGTGYKQEDPCFRSLVIAKQCRNMIDGAAFIGVGFDGRGEYSPESRKMSIIQRSCGGGSSYDDLQVPDTMNVHGIYDTSAHMSVFTSREEYQRYLQQESGVSGSFFGFYAGVKKAWGSSESGAKQSNLAIFDIDIDRYEIFQDEVKPQDLSRSFLREFVELPMSYFAPGAPAKFQDFILRWGTHYIKSARFGGQLELRKTQLASMTASKEEFAQESEAEYKSLFWSAGSRSSTKSGESSKSQKKYMSTSVVVQGGSQRIAAVISDMYSPTFKTEFTAWLESIPTYPKAFKFLLGPVTDLLDFRANDLFPDEKVDWGCEKATLIYDKKKEKSYYLENNKRVYCEFSNRNEMEFSLERKRVSLKRAIEVYMEEGSMSISDVSLPAGEAGCQSKNPEYQSKIKSPSWAEITTEKKRVHVIFDMLKDLKGEENDGIDIPRSMSRIVQFSDGKWYTTNENGDFHLYEGFDNGGSSNLGNKKFSIFGLILTYNEADGSLVLKAADYQESLKYFPQLGRLLINKQLARVEWPTQNVFQQSIRNKNSLGHLPCNVKWSNGLRFDPSDSGGKCVHFTASTKGSLYVVFSAVPSNKDSWYYVEVSSHGVGIYKSKQLKVSTVNTNAVALGDSLLYQSYFVCITESTTSTLIEYGKSQGTTDSGDVYLSMVDHDQPLHVRFYSFGNGEESMQVVDSHVVSRKLTTTDCKGDTHKDQKEQICAQRCHEACNPLAGCKSNSQGEPKASECNECRFAKIRNGECVNECPTGESPNKDNFCTTSFDLKFKRDAQPEDADITGFPTLNSFTICFWFNARLISNKGSSFYTVLEYFNRGYKYGLFDIQMIRSVRDNTISVGISFREDENKYRASGTSTSIKKDNKWHQFCVTRDSNSGKVDYFVDGTKPDKMPSTKFLSPRKFPRSGGKMHFGGFKDGTFPGEISGLNVWDRILKDDEISNMALTCGENRGNVKDWSDIKDELTLSKFTVVTPSQCKTEA